MTKAKTTVPSQEVQDELAAPLAVQAPAIEEEGAPIYVKLGVTPAATLARVRVVDSATGDLIDKVIEADSEKKLVVRYAVEDGALVREDNHFKTIEESRDIRIEWATGNQKDSF